jgi:lipopolysaccharide export system protein LptC
MASIRLSAAVLICALSAGCRPGRTGDARDVVPELTMEGVRFSIDRGGVTRAHGEAERLTYRRDTTALAATGLSLFMVGGPDGEVRLTAPRGAGVVADRVFDVEGGIQATRGGDVASTGSARFEAPQGGSGLVSGTEPVTITGPGYRLTGRGFSLLPSSGEIVLRGGSRLVTGLPVTP